MSTVPTGLFCLMDCTLHLPGSWEMLRDAWEVRRLGHVLFPCSPSLPNSFTLTHCHCTPNRGLFHTNRWVESSCPILVTPLVLSLSKGRSLIHEVWTLAQVLGWTELTCCGCRQGCLRCWVQLTNAFVLVPLYTNTKVQTQQ